MSFILTSTSQYAYSSSTEPILITSSLSMEKIIFDGKWTFTTEWKDSSLNEFSNEDKKIILRSAHQNNFIYFYIDTISDFTLNKGLDEAIVCIDGQNNKNKISDENDYCFSATLENNEGIVFQGNTETKNFEKIPNPENFIGLSSVSDENNRYNKIPHVSYEFKIPIDLIQRSDNYGFYLSVYDANSDVRVSWPNNSDVEKSLKITSPNNWGDIVSPDKSLPELNLPLIVLMISILSIIVLQSKSKLLIKHF